jgi:hypothetical protein
LPPAGTRPDATPPTTLPKKYGTAGGQALPDWFTAKAKVAVAQAAAAANTDNTKTAALQTAYTNAVNIQTYVDYLLNFRIDLLGDIRSFRNAFKY